MKRIKALISLIGLIGTLTLGSFALGEIIRGPEPSFIQCNCQYTLTGERGVIAPANPQSTKLTCSVVNCWHAI
jgi:hypothetical protein